MMRNISIAILINIIAVTGFAQSKAKEVQPAKKNLQKVKLISRFASYKDSITLTVDQLKALISEPLTITDEKGNSLSVSSFEMAYKRIVMYQDETTGKKNTSIQMSSALFKSPTLSPNWIKIIKRDLMPSDELLFFDIIAKDKKGMVYYAPDIKIKTK